MNIKLLRTFFLILIIVLISFFESNSLWVEQYYYLQFYPKISSIQRIIFGWIPFSVGDVVYVIFILIILSTLFIFIKSFIQKKYNFLFLLKGFQHALNVLLVLYIAFKLLWGLNYSRQGIHEQLQISEDTCSKQEVMVFIEKLISDANFYRNQIADTALPKINFDTVVQETKASYNKAKKQFPFAKINTFSLKQNLYSSAGNYLGYTGYYNPFTGEAQVRTDIPAILTPAIAVHEVAHQLGFASEDEANFMAYLICNTSSNLYFKYSITLELLDYAFKDLMIKYIKENDFKNFRYIKFQLEDCCSEFVKKDRKEIKQFFLKNKKDISNISSSVYDQYLKLNKEKMGVEAYTNVVEIILNYENSKFVISKEE